MDFWIFDITVSYVRVFRVFASVLRLGAHTFTEKKRFYYEGSNGNPLFNITAR